jgi:hypothetical protein
VLTAIGFRTAILGAGVAVVTVFWFVDTAGRRVAAVCRAGAVIGAVDDAIDAPAVGVTGLLGTGIVVGTIEGGVQALTVTGAAGIDGAGVLVGAALRGVDATVVRFTKVHRTWVQVITFSGDRAWDRGNLGGQILWRDGDVGGLTVVAVVSYHHVIGDTVVRRYRILRGKVSCGAISRDHIGHLDCSAGASGQQQQCQDSGQSPSHGASKAPVARAYS